MKIELKINAASNHGAKSCLCRQALATIGACLTSLCSGLIFGITAVMLPQLREDKSIEYDQSQDSWIASVASLSMIIGSLSSGQILDSYGRKAAQIILGIPLVVGWTAVACANSTSLILIGRVIMGLSTGANKPVSLVYIGEIAAPEFRTVALFLPGLAGHLGVLLSHIIGHYLSWKNSAIVCIVPAVLTCIIFLFLKESPLWLIAQGRMEEGIETFQWFRGTEDCADKELKAILQKQTNKPNISTRETLNAVYSISFMKPMFLLMVLMLNIQFSGVNVIIFYSQDIFERVFSGNVDAYILMIAMDCLRGFIAVVICLLGRSIPKKIAFLTSSFAVSVFVFGMSVSFMMKLESLWMSVLCMVMYIGFSSAIITIGWTFVPELLPSNARGFGSGLNSAFAYLMLFINVKFSPDFIDAYGDLALFGLYGVSTFVCGFILCFVLPETNGKTLQSIEDSYNKNKMEQTSL